MSNLSDLLLLPNGGEIIDPNGSVSISIPLAALDPSHPEIPDFLKHEVLKLRHRNNFIEDGLSTGHICSGPGGYSFMSQASSPTFVGFVFEALTVRVLNTNQDSKCRAIAWASNRQNVGKDFAAKYKAIGTGLPNTKNLYPNFYAPQDAMDIKFIRERHNKLTSEYFFDPLEVMGTHLSAGIQVKAITCNERWEIIEPIRLGKYSRVITYLRHQNGLHSHNECIRILEGMYKAGEIGAEERWRLMDSIRSPESLGLDQSQIDEYVEFVRMAHCGRANADPLFLVAANMEIKYRKNIAGILVPDSLGGSN